MTKPHDPHDDRFEPYPSTPHPEDAPGYGQQPYQGYQGYAGYPGAGGHGGHGDFDATGTGDGRVRPMEAVGWGLRQTFRNWPIWIIGTLVLGIAVLAVSFGVDLAFGGPSADLSYQDGFGYQAVQVVMWILLGVLSIFVYRGALRQVDKPRIGLGDFTSGVNFWPAFGVLVVIQLITGIALSLLVIPILLGGNDVANLEMASQDEALATLSRLFAGLAIMMVVAVLIAPLTIFMVWFAVDRRASFGGAFAAGFRAGARNYLRLLLFSVVSGFAAMILAVLTFGLAMVVVGPVLLLAQAYMYRQAARGPLPAPRS